MKEIDATEIKLKCLRMVEGTNLEWWEVIRPVGWSTPYGTKPLFTAEKDQYELALGIVEGKPVWKGDELWNTKGGFKTAGMHIHPTCWNQYSWNPPKPKTIPVELPLEVVEAAASNYLEAWHYEILFSASRDALDRRNPNIKCQPEGYKSSYDTTKGRS